MARVGITIEVDAPPAALMAVLTDFGAYPRFLADMEEASVLRHDGAEWTVRFVLHVIRRLEYTLRLVQEGPLRLHWSLVEGVFKANSGSWQLEPLDEGARTRATYDLELDLGMFLPGSVQKTLVEHNLPATMVAFKAEAEARAAATPR